MANGSDNTPRITLSCIFSRLRWLSVALVSLFLGVASFAHASLIDLGAAADYGILGLNGATINLSSGPLRVNDNVGVGNNAALNFSGGGQINGSVNYASSATLNTGGNTISGGTHQIDFSATQNDALALASSAASLTPTQTFGSITSPLTITGSGSQNVISVTNDIHLSGGNLTLSGGPNDTFIFNVAGTMELSGNTNIVLSGGVNPSQVPFNFLGTGSQVQTSGQIRSEFSSRLRGSLTSTAALTRANLFRA